MPLPTALPPEALYVTCIPDDLGFVTSDELADLPPGQIQQRAVEALHMGLDMHHPGYNLFVLGEPGSGRHAIVRQLLEEERHEGTMPADWCYVFDFSAPEHPRLLRLPCGRGAGFRDAMQHFVEELIPAIAAVFESDDYRRRLEAMQDEEKQQEEAALQALAQEALGQGVVLVRTPGGFAFVPMKDDESPMNPEEFSALPEERQQTLQSHTRSLRERFHETMNDFPRMRRCLQQRIREAGREALQVTVTHLVADLRKRFDDLPVVQTYLDGVLQDILDSGESLRESTHSEGDTETTTYSGMITVQRYLVNLLVENPADGQRPVVWEDHPTLQNLVGHIEHMVHMGTLMSNFTLIRAGALQRANGGFLVLDALKVLSQPYAWEGLKRSLTAAAVRIESLSDLLGLGSTVQIEPEAMPLTLKVVLIGERLIYYLLSQHDPDFPALFRINADLESEIVRSAENTSAYARLIATLARRDGLRPFTAAAVARIIEHSARLAEDGERLSARTQPVNDLMREADHFAARADALHVGRGHVEEALAARRRRNEHFRRHALDAILRGQLLVACTGSHVGQVNGLAVVPLGEATFAHPVRITATVRPGDGEVLDVEREVKMGGPIHSKGVLILTAFLGHRHGRSQPLSLRASLVFEQSYGGIEGDSASLAELTALLSAIGGLPIRQGLAVTGSVNQFGMVQPVGGINDKVEGFFALCQARGLDGEQGVLIPAPSRHQLMLSEEVVAAVRAGRFHVWAVATVDEALSLLTGQTPAGLDARVKTGLEALDAAQRSFAHRKPS
ncbi:ATP-binding protein [Zoogloea sp.]|uniref:Lon protease family protein n=1 Tax=Zoogloea sp. TaxID=49181 RepID=UPI00260CB567|nr:ATP-binding protein [Zoogloea sp.]MDD3353308.1 AAA family ATPase [Zoogloea sp.]